MAKGDEWCDFCNDKIKNEFVKVNGKTWHVCSQCASLTIEDKK